VADAARSRLVETNHPLEAVLAAELKPDGSRSRLLSHRSRASTDGAVHRACRARGRTSQSAISGCRFAWRSGRLVAASSGAAAPRPIRQRGSSRPRCCRSGRACACTPASVRQANGLNVTVPRSRSGTVDTSAARSSGIRPTGRDSRARSGARSVYESDGAGPTADRRASSHDVQRAAMSSAPDPMTTAKSGSGI
jgi:hypothetical protein